MSKRTLDAFLVSPATVTAKKAKSGSTARNAGRSQPKLSAQSPAKSKANVVEVVDLDEIIDVDSPSPSPPRALIIDGSSEKSIPEDVKEKLEDGGDSGILHADRSPTAIVAIPDASSNSATIIQPPPNIHASYPFPIPCLPPNISGTISAAPIKQPKHLNHLPHLDLLTYEPYLGAKESREYGEFLRRELPFYRVEYKITKFGKPTDIKTPRFTTVFGVDETSRFAPDGSLVETATGKPIAKNKYKIAKPRPIPNCLDELRKSVEAATGTIYNYALVNYYATGADSISYHSDDEHFLEKEPAIASFSFLGIRDFFLKHKPLDKDGGKANVADEDPAFAENIAKAAGTPLKFALRSGTLILMRGTTQSNWLHSIPKRAGDGGGGRINITFRRNMTAAGTENYYRYNVGTGGVWKWDERRRQMVLVGNDAE